LYAKATVAFTFVRTPTFREVINWFQGVNYTPTQYADPTKKNQAEGTQVITGPAVEVAPPG